MAPDWEARYRDRSVAEAAPAEVLRDNAHLLPRSGTALDLACGLGGNGFFLARRGLETFAWDSSSIAVEKIDAASEPAGLPLFAEVRNVVERPPEAGRFDVLVVSRFLERELAPALIAALRPSGLLFYQTFTQDRVTGRGPRSEGFRLEANELLDLFSPLRVMVYREEGRVGDLTRGWRDEAALVAYKPLPE